MEAILVISALVTLSFALYVVRTIAQRKNEAPTIRRPRYRPRPEPVPEEEEPAWRAFNQRCPSVRYQ